MNLLLEKSKHIKYYGSMNDVFDVLVGICEKYDWYISDIETNRAPPWGLDVQEIRIDGLELKKILTDFDIQFIWAVFSAIPKGVTPLVSEPPYADGNPEFWTGKPRPQLHAADFEIVCWDSALFLLIGISEEIGQKFLSVYTDAVDLDEHNRQQSLS